MKRFILIVICVVALGVTWAYAGVKSSQYIDQCTAQLRADATSGDLLITGRISNLSSMSVTGASQLDVYTSSGAYVKTIVGTTSNGLLTSSRKTYNFSYPISASTGQSYYVVVTFYSENSNGSESRSFTTNIASI